jgi:D-alanyl-D-alanine dipeptidase
LLGAGYLRGLINALASWARQDGYKLLAQNPALNAAALRRETHQYIASPDVAGHPTGGAVDVTLCRSGTELPMGGAIWDIRDTERIPTFSEKVTADERSNRLYLRTLMLSADFAPFDGEWWHFSYGDREWAAYYQKEFALYEMVGCTGAPPSFVHLLRFLS